MTAPIQRNLVRAASNALPQTASAAGQIAESVGNLDNAVSMLEASAKVLFERLAPVTHPHLDPVPYEPSTRSMTPMEHAVSAFRDRIAFLTTGINDTIDSLAL